MGWCADHADPRESRLCITDGASAWKDLIDPYKHSKVLMESIIKTYVGNEKKYCDDLQGLLKDCELQFKEFGGSCCLVLALDDMESNDSNLFSYVVGDCGYILFRKNEGRKLEIIHKRKEKTKVFNKSHQIGYDADFSSFGAANQHIIQENDLIISGSDGLFDNLYEWDIINCLKPFIESHDKILDLELVAEIIGNLAIKRSKELSYNSPFAKNAYDFYVDYIGGKLDDITVIVSQSLKSEG